MSTSLTHQLPGLPATHTAGVLPIGQPSSRAVVRSTRRQVDVALAEAEVTHARDQARAVLASSALANTAALAGLAQHCAQIAPAGGPHYQAILQAYALGAARAIARF